MEITGIEHIEGLRMKEALNQTELSDNYYFQLFVKALEKKEEGE